MSGREREPAPERIWIDRGPRGGWMHRDDQKMPDSEREYVRADLMKAALTAAGYRIIGPGEVDPVTVERCVNTIAKANERVASVEAPVMGGDNLAICLCSFFDDGDKETEDDTGWSVAARNGYEQTIEAIREHYATALRSLTEAKP